MWISTYKNGHKSLVLTTLISMSCGLRYDWFCMEQSMLQKMRKT
jgi:hypothetical protein